MGCNTIKVVKHLQLSCETLTLPYHVLTGDSLLRNKYRGLLNTHLWKRPLSMAPLKFSTTKSMSFWASSHVPAQLKQHIKTYYLTTETVLYAHLNFPSWFWDAEPSMYVQWGTGGGEVGVKYDQAKIYEWLEMWWVYVSAESIWKASRGDVMSWECEQGETHALRWKISIYPELLTHWWAEGTVRKAVVGSY